MRRLLLGGCVTVLALGVVSCPIGTDSSGSDEPLRVAAGSRQLVHQVAALARASGVRVVASGRGARPDAELLEPVTIYAATSPVGRLRALPAGTTIAVPQRPESQSRALRLLARKGILSLREGSGSAATRWDIVANPRRVRLVVVPLPSAPSREFPQLSPRVASSSPTTSLEFPTDLSRVPRRSGDSAARWSLLPYDLSDIVRARDGLENDQRIATLRKVLARRSD